MKKLLALLLVLVLAFSLIACDNTSDNPENGGSNSENSGNNTDGTGNGGNPTGGEDDSSGDEPVIEGPIIPWPLD